MHDCKMAYCKVAILVTGALCSVLGALEKQTSCQQSMQALAESYEQCKRSQCYGSIQIDMLDVWLNSGCALGIGDKRVCAQGMRRSYTVANKASPSESPLTVMLPDVLINKGPISVSKASDAQSTCQERIRQVKEKYKQCKTPECHDDIQTDIIEVWMNSKCSMGVSNRQLGIFGIERTYTVLEAKSPSKEPVTATLPDVLQNKKNLHGNDDFTRYCLLKVTALDSSFKDCKDEVCYKEASVATTRLFKKGCLWALQESATGQEEGTLRPRYFYETFDYRMSGCGLVLLPDIWKDGTAFQTEIKAEKDEPAKEYDTIGCKVKEVGKRFDTCRTQECFDTIQEEVYELFKKKCVSFARQWEEYELTPKVFGPTYYYYTSFGYINTVALPDIWAKHVINDDPKRACTENKMIMKA